MCCEINTKNIAEFLIISFHIVLPNKYTKTFHLQSFMSFVIRSVTFYSLLPLLSGFSIPVLNGVEQHKTDVPIGTSRYICTTSHMIH